MTVYAEFYDASGHLAHHDVFPTPAHALRASHGHAELRTCPSEWVPHLAWLHKDEPCGVAYLK